MQMYPKVILKIKTSQPNGQDLCRHRYALLIRLRMSSSHVHWKTRGLYGIVHPFGTLDRYNNFFSDKKPKNFVNTFDISFHLDIIQRNFLFQSKFKTRELSIISTNYIWIFSFLSFKIMRLHFISGNRALTSVEIFPSCAGGFR